MHFTNKQLLCVIGVGVVVVVAGIILAASVNGGSQSSSQPIANSTVSSSTASGNLTQPTTGTTQIPTTIVTLEPSHLPRGQLILTSEPAGATVLLDNQAKGVTPLTLNSVENGDHTVTFQLSGYQTRTMDVTVASNSKTIDVELQPNEKPTTTATTSISTSTTTSVTTTVTESTTIPATTSATTSVATIATESSTASQQVTITQVNPTYIHTLPGSASTQTISITGTGLATPAGMKLTGMNTIPATTYTAASDSSASGVFTIPAGTTGSYSVVLVDAAGTTLATSTVTVAIVSYS
jgi:hypothetical protein